MTNSEPVNSGYKHIHIYTAWEAETHTYTKYLFPSETLSWFQAAGVWAAGIRWQVCQNMLRC